MPEAAAVSGPFLGVGLMWTIFVVAAVASRRWPLAAAVVASGTYIGAVQAGSFDPAGSDAATQLASVGILLAVGAIAYAVGIGRPTLRSLCGLLVLVGATQWQDLNPFPAALIVGIWIVGWLVRSQQELAATLEARGQELAAERKRYVREAVRYERARIARELHDIVAHCMSIVVIQASAGQRLDRFDQASTQDVLRDIGELARQAEGDIAALVRLLNRSEALSLDLIDALVVHSGLAGTRVEVHVAGDLGAIDPPTASALARTLQEGLTNACKHAPGAAVVVRLDSGRITTVLQIQNERPAKPSVWIGGGGNGLRGIRERVSELGGTVRSAPTPSGGWLLRIELPAAASPARSDLPAEHRSEADSHS